MKNKPFFLVRVWRFYVNGFRQMTWGRTLWMIIGIKLFVMFGILRLFFFQPYYKGLDKTETADRVGTVLSTSQKDSLQKND